MLRMCVYMHSRFVENHLIWILEDGPLISEVVLSQTGEAYCGCQEQVGQSLAARLVLLQSSFDSEPGSQMG
jgi:hypothetical protein